MSKKRVCNVVFLALIATLLFACGVRVSPTPFLSPTVRASWPTALTVDIPEASCTVDEDCTFAFSLDRCCDCGAIYARRSVDAEPHLLLYHERWDYDYAVPRVTPADCSGVQCAPCLSPPLGPICADGMCRAPEKWDEVSILSFEVSPAEIWPGEAVTLTWNSIAERVSIIRPDDAGMLSNPAFAVPVSGTLVLTTQPTLRHSAIFSLYACSADMRICKSAGVQVKVACPDVWFFSNPPADCAGMPHHTAFVAQTFERGLMLWMKASDEVQIYDLIIILYNDEGWSMLPDSWVTGMPEEDPGIIPPPGYDEPRRGFGKVWRENQEVRDRLGWATGQEFVVGDGTFQCGTAKHNRCYFTGPDNEIYVLEPYGSGWSIWPGSTSAP